MRNREEKNGDFRLLVSLLQARKGRMNIFTSVFIPFSLVGLLVDVAPAILQIIFWSSTLSITFWFIYSQYMHLRNLPLEEERKRLGRELEVSYADLSEERPREMGFLCFLLSPLARMNITVLRMFVWVVVVTLWICRAYIV